MSGTTEIVTFDFEDANGIEQSASFTITLGAADGNGYDLTSISGTIDGQTITGFSGLGGADNIFYPDPTANGSYVDGGGVSVTTSASDSWNFYGGGGTYSIFDIDGLAQDPNASNVDANPACYASGTRILTVEGEIPVESLKIGDLVITAAGTPRPIKWIGRRAYIPPFANANPHLLPICFKAGSLGSDLPLRDLHVSPKHAMFIDGVLIPAECLVNGASIVRATRVDTALEYYHIELETHDVLLAEGAPSESFVDDDSRGMFHNAHEYWAAHPQDIGRDAIYCAPRHEGGYELAAIRARLAAIAGIARPQDHGALLGYFAVDGQTVSGWARNALCPDAQVCLDILVDGRRVAQTLATLARADTHGPHGFAAGLPPGYGGVVMVRRSLDGAPLPAADSLAQAA
jgi:hypothetical protein